MAQRLCATTALITVLHLAICLVGGFATSESPADSGALRQLLQSNGELINTHNPAAMKNAGGTYMDT
jgi:hypothetical protein